jgi:hypothetical protein
MKVIDPQDGFAAAEFELAQRFRSVPARLRFPVGVDGVFEIDYDRVRGERRGFGDAAGLVGGYEEQTSPRPLPGFLHKS